MSVCEEDQQGKHNDACKQDMMMCARACESSTPRYIHLNHEKTSDREELISTKRRNAPVAHIFVLHGSTPLAAIRNVVA